MNAYEAVGRLVVAGLLDLLTNVLLARPRPVAPPSPAPAPPSRKRSARNAAPARRRKNR